MATGNIGFTWYYGDNATTQGTSIGSGTTTISITDNSTSTPSVDVTRIVPKLGGKYIKCSAKLTGGNPTGSTLDSTTVSSEAKSVEKASKVAGTISATQASGKTAAQSVSFSGATFTQASGSIMENGTSANITGTNGATLNVTWYYATNSSGSGSTSFSTATSITNSNYYSLGGKWINYSASLTNNDTTNYDFTTVTKSGTWTQLTATTAKVSSVTAPTSLTVGSSATFKINVSVS